jgi:hypothetical protein
VCTTVLLPNESFCVCNYQRDLKSRTDIKSRRRVRTDGPLTDHDDVIYHTTLPWISFHQFRQCAHPGRATVPRFRSKQQRKRSDHAASGRGSSRPMDGPHAADSWTDGRKR